MKVNEFVRPTAEEQFSEEDVAKVIDAEVNGKWVTRSAEELIAHTLKLCSGESND